MKKHFDAASLSVILVTLALFLSALFTKGFTHDLLLEAGVFLVSVKLIILAYKNSIAVETLLNEMQKIKSSMKDEH